MEISINNKLSTTCHVPCAKTRQGFTLIELIIVISIIGLLVAFLLPNLTGARGRARDAAKKGELHAMRTAMNIYQNQFGTYPPAMSGLTFNGCGASGTSACSCSGNPDWASGSTVFMANFACNGNFVPFRYYPCSGGTNYRLKVTLENKSDPDIATSHSRCPDSACNAYLGAQDYVVCP